MKIRCSALGKVMTNARSKTGLSETCKSYIKELVLEDVYGIKKDFWSRYTDKGIRVEKESIQMANDILGWGLTFGEINGDQKYFENEYITGHTDVCTDHILADVKSSWDANTFPFFDEKIDKNYMWQLMGYMYLTGHDKGNLTYCLVNTPEDMVQDEIRREHWKQNAFWQGDEDPEIIEYVRSQHNFDHLPKELRVRNMIIERDEDLINSMKERIEECREYYKLLLSKIN